MPELPEVETTKKELKLILLNKNINKILVNTNSLRVPIKKNKIKKLEGSKVVKVSRRGKYLLIATNKNYTLLIHLGMSGRLIYKKKKYISNKHDHVVFIIDKNLFIILNDPRKFGLIDAIMNEKVFNCNYLKNLGIEPLTNNFCSKYLKKVLVRSKTKIKNFLLNQKIIAGLGNIYVSESLYDANISPLKISNTLNKKQIFKLCQSIKKVLIKAINSKGSSINNYKSPSGLLGNFQDKFKVYDREGKNCKNKNCNKKITKVVISGRSSYYCKKCQKI